MTGWRIAFAAGNADALAAWYCVKNNLDSGSFGAIQAAGIAALQGLLHHDVKEQRDVYRNRRDVLVGGLREAGWVVAMPKATFYVCAACPAGLDSMTVASRMLDEADVVAIPGVGFGPAGENHVRFALTVPVERIKQALDRIAKISF